MWIKLDNLGDGTVGCLFSAEGSVNIREDNTATGEVSIKFADGGSNPSLSTTTPTNDTWYHLAGVYNNGDVELFIDGNSEATDSSTNSSLNMGSTNRAWIIGHLWDTTSEAYDGSIDDVRIYDRVLSQPEIEALSNLSSTSKVYPGDTV